ncbi:MAG: exlusion protein FxsA [Legionellales bacterium]|nr:exlusion protein FxsA [Legionellales bacterium]HBH10816.1 exlusion protein FxsA [Gammaproteobacteria bacterium]
MNIEVIFLFKLFLILFITIPLVEIAILIKIGSIIGAGYTIALVIGTAFLGVSLLRIQGISTLAKVQANISRGQLPATELIEGLILLISGALLLTPGFFTDTIGFLMLVPTLRQRLAETFFVNFMKNRINIRQKQTRNGNIIEGEHWDSDSE